MKYLPYVLIWVICFSVTYLLKSFVLMSFDASTWTPGNREAVVMAAFAASTAITVIRILWQEFKDLK